MKPPTYHCGLCQRTVEVKPGGRGFPPDRARKRLFALCEAAGCPCEPRYVAGIA